MYSQINYLIKIEYIREFSLRKKNNYVFPNELPTIIKNGGKKREKNIDVFLLRGGFIIVNRELTYFITGGFINVISILYIYSKILF